MKTWFHCALVEHTAPHRRFELGDYEAVDREGAFKKCEVAYSRLLKRLETGSFHVETEATMAPAERKKRQRVKDATLDMFR